MKRKSISDRRSVENISDKRLRNKVQPAQTNGVERVKRSVNVYMHLNISNLKTISKFRRCPSHTEIVSADAHGCSDFDLILGAVWFNSFKPLKNEKCQSQLLYTLMLNQHLCDEIMVMLQ